MKSTLSFGIVMILFSAVVRSDDAADERKRLDGTWTASAAELQEKPFDEGTLKVIKLVLDGEKYSVGNVDKGTVKIDPKAKIKTMDIVGTDGPNKGKTILAIYELDGDTLRICYDLTGKMRPTEFKTKKGEKLFLAMYNRVKS